MNKISKQIIECFKRGNIVFLYGNGGSFDLANHIEEEFVCKFEHNRKPLPALALKPHTSTSNDYGYDYVFSRQLAAYGKKGDIAIGISTSGNSQNVVNANNLASSHRLTVINFPRKGKTTSEIQEYQLHLMHLIVREVEKAFL